MTWSSTLMRRSSWDTFSRAFSSLKAAPESRSCCSYWRRTSSICSSTDSASGSRPCSRPMASTARRPRSSASHLGLTTLRYFSKPSGLIICLIWSSGVPPLRRSVSMTWNFWRALSDTRADGSLLVMRWPRASSRALCTASVVLSSSWAPTVFSTSTWSSASVRPSRILDANASFSSGMLRVLTSLTVTSKAALTPARGCSSR
mmetsp:Transcript_16593/g.49547  ORF Transcript_16593/g.49547 Transcript_16593/m.49547 type:complete len:203 (-) Transcript_16593:965-1573(-)